MGSSFSVSTIFSGKDRMSPVFNKMGKAAYGFRNIIGGILGASFIQSGFQKLKQGAASFIVEASKIEDVTAAFTPLMGGTQRAIALVDQLNETAATTPFQFENISAAAKQLLPVMNQDITKTVDTFRMLGDTAGGNAQKLDSITRGFTKSMLKGKVDMESLNMIAEAGVPIYSELSKSMGVSVAEMMKMSSAGKISSDSLVSAFKMMTSEGGIFFRGMEIASETLTGRWSTFKDNVLLTAAAIGQTFLPKIKQVVDLMINAASGVRQYIVANRELISSKIDAFIQKVNSVLKVAIPIFKTIFNSAIELGKAIFNIGKIIFSMFVPANNNAMDSVTTFTDILNILIKTVTSVINIVSVLIQKNKALNIVISYAIGLIKYLGTVLALLNFIINPTADNFDLLKLRLQSLWIWFKNVGAAIAEAWDKIKGWATLLSGPLLPLVLLVDIIKNLIMQFSTIKQAFTDGGFIAGIKAIGNAMLDGLVGPFQAAFEKLKIIGSGLLFIFNPIKDFFINIGSIIYDSFLNLLDFAFDKLSGLKNLAVGAIDKIKSFLGIGNEEKKKIEAPNKKEVAAKSKMQWEGNLNIAGAPAGSTLEQKSKGAPPMRYQLLGAN